jgi:3,5-epimerase/4-reductase
MNKKFEDMRGRLLFPIKNNDVNYKECTISTNMKNVFRGIHINNFDKLVTCINGKILDIIINFNENAEDYLKPQYFILDPNTDNFEILVKKNYGHAFLSLEDNSIVVYHLDGIFIDSETKHIHYMDPYININLPSNDIILSEKDDIKNFVKDIDYIVFGSTGFLGSNIVKYLTIENKNFIICKLRLQQTNEIIKFLNIYKPKYVINCAGLTGTPNIFWCNDNKVETIETNLTYQLTMAKICNDMNIHLTIFGSGGIFKNDKLYKESDEGNFTNNFYSEMRIYLENIVKNYNNVLYLRINYPMSNEKSDKNLLTKLLSYKNIDSVELSITYIDNLFPILFKMIGNNETGVCNFTNPGTINLIDIITTYNMERSSSLLECDKLLKYNPLTINQSVVVLKNKYYL